MKKFLLIFCVLTTSWSALAQDESIEDLFKTNYETPLTIDMDVDLNEDDDQLDKENAKKKKKKKNPKIYYGIKTKKGFAKSGFGSNTVLELFFYLKDKDYEGPGEYTRDFYWFDFKKKKIVNSLKIKRERAGVLHGKYTKKIGEQVLEEGYFYKGKKHGRWVRYNRHDILQDKENFHKGWLQESLLSYYDFERSRLKEIIPVKYGERHGEYFAYHPNGNLAVVGHYHYDYKIGVWREYYENQRVKREVKYPLEPFDEDAKPYILKEWDEKGNVIYDHKLYEARVD